MTEPAKAGRVHVRSAPAAELARSPALGGDALHTDAGAIAALVACPPFAAKTKLLACRGSLERGCRYVVAIPVRSEERRLPATLDALAVTMRAVRTPGCAVFVVNDTDDRSADVIAQWSRRSRISALVVEVAFSASIRNAPHARRLALDIAARAVPHGILFTTDADTTVGEAWVERGIQSVAAGSDLVCEDVQLDEQELSALPRQVREVGAAERAYFDLCDLLWRYWTFGRAGQLAARPSGASLAITASAYLSLGGLPLPAVGEDRALHDLVVRSGLVVEALKNGGTRTSARLTSRAAGGCGDALADRAASEDPFCDSHLKPVSLLYDEATLWLELDSATGRRRCPMPKDHDPMRFSTIKQELASARRMAAAYGLIDAP
ncbi:hypothetical protein AAG607_05225 [Citromicrobium bathyomarinum]|uniref:hypothetical protein n=1 Tax=Sphingomonadales TaxID=204457 RepID=UPI0026D26AD4